MVFERFDVGLDRPVSPTLQELLDERAIANVLQRYGWALDSRDWELLATCFADDASLHYDTSGAHDSPAAFVANCQRNVSHVDSTQHFVFPPVVKVDGDEAQSRAYVMAQHAIPGESEQLYLGGVYHDGFVRTASGWTIRSRRFVVGWTNGPAIDFNALRAQQSTTGDGIVE